MAHWTTEISNGLQRVNHAAVLIGQRIYSFGGYVSGKHDNYTEEWIDVSALDTVTNRWMAIHQTNDMDDVPEEDRTIQEHPVPYRRYAHTVVEYEGKAYLFGGFCWRYRSTNIVHEFDPLTISWRKLKVSGTVPPSLYGHTAVVFDNKMIVFGGFEEDNEQYSQETYVFNFETYEWSQMRYATNSDRTPIELPNARDYHTAVVINKKMYVFGGRIDEDSDPNGQIYDNALWVLDIETRRWTKEKVSGQIPVGKRSHSAWVHNGFMYTFGGYLALTKTHYNDIHRYDTAKRTWTIVEPRGKGPSKRRRQCSIVVKNQVFVFGGSTPVMVPSRREHGAFREKMVDASDLHILDFAPSLKTLAMMSIFKNVKQTIVDNNFDDFDEFLPRDLKKELLCFKLPNSLFENVPRREDKELRQMV